ncbi:MAG TPA: hypothetical protein VLI54_06760 [Bacillota bacterium]|nr:hypothetical protein [Bacillota bacterium]
MTTPTHERPNLDCVYVESGFTEPAGWSEPVVVPMADLPAGGTEIDAGYDDENRFCAAGGCDLTQALYLDYALTTVTAPGSAEDIQTGDAVLAAVAPGCALAGLIRANRGDTR